VNREGEAGKGGDEEGEEERSWFEERNFQHFPPFKTLQTNVEKTSKSDLSAAIFGGDVGGKGSLSRDESL